MVWPEEGQEAGQATALTTSILRNPTQVQVTLQACPGPQAPQRQPDSAPHPPGWRPRTGCQRGLKGCPRFPQNISSSSPPPRPIRI